MPQNTPQKICKHCKSSMPAKAKVCPQCGRKQGGILKWILIGFLVICILGAVAGGGSDDDKSSAKSDSSSKTESTETADTAETTEKAEDTQDETSETQESSDEGDLGDYHVKINDATFGTDYQGNRMIVVHYDFTNNSDKAQSALIAIGNTAFQDGVELEIAIALDDSVYDASISQRDIQPGITIEDCQIAYVLTSDSPVEFEASELISFSDKKLTKTFDVSQ